MDLELRRRFYAEELEAVCTLKSPALVDAFAAVPRERYLRPGPWTVMADVDFMGPAGTRLTPDADPARVFTVVAIYSAVSVRDETMNERIGKAMMGGPMKWAAVKGLRRDAHEEAGSCWLHGKGFCLTT